MKVIITLALLLIAPIISADELLIAIRKASDMAAAASMPPALVTSDFVEYNASGEPYRMKCQPQANKIILYLHPWASDYTSVGPNFPELSSAMSRACIVSPNFNGDNSNANALGSDESIDRIDLAVKEAQAKTGLTRIYITAASGGTMAALSYMGRYPGKVYMASLWLVIHDLASLYNTTSDQLLRTDMLHAIGHPPNGPDDPDYLARSPRSRLPGIAGVARIYLNYGTLDTNTPAAQAVAAKAQINSVAPDIDVKLIAWPINHSFVGQSRNEALKQLLLE